MEEKLVYILRTPYTSEIAFIKSLLDANKIPYFIENEHFASLRGPADGAINFGVMVQSKYAEEAKSLLKELIEPKPKEVLPRKISMGKKKPLGVKIMLALLLFPFILYTIALSIAFLASGISEQNKIEMIQKDGFVQKYGVTSVEELNQMLKKKTAIFFNLKVLSLTVLPFILALGLVKLKNWARILIIVFAIYAIFSQLIAYKSTQKINIVDLIYIPIYLWFIFYLTRSRLREKFN